MSIAPLIAMVVTVVFEVPIVAWVFKGQRLRMACVCALTTGATNLFMNTIFRGWIHSTFHAILFGELGAFLLEAAVYALASRPRDLRRALVASALANAVSFLVGFIL